MIFVNKKDTAEFLHTMVNKALAGAHARFLTSSLTVPERDRIIDEFRMNYFSCLISTNVLARGIDVPAVDIVINYDIPVLSDCGYMEPDYPNYLHRVGRTGRFMTDGLALTFVEDEVEETQMSKISKHWETDIAEIKSFEEFHKIYIQMRPAHTLV